jgi:BioD-like phosphotransacetylase family protein
MDTNQTLANQSPNLMGLDRAALQQRAAGMMNVTLQGRIDHRRRKAEQELMKVAELQTLLNSLPEGTTAETLSQLVNL